MSGKITRHAYQQMIGENLVVLRKQMPDSLEKQHIEAILIASVDIYYPPKEVEPGPHRGRAEFSFTCDRIKKTLEKYRGL